MTVSVEPSLPNSPSGEGDFGRWEWACCRRGAEDRASSEGVKAPDVASETVVGLDPDDPDGLGSPASADPAGRARSTTGGESVPVAAEAPAPGPGNERAEWASVPAARSALMMSA